MPQKGRWTKPPAGRGDDPREIDEEFRDDDAAARQERSRPVIHDQEPAGQQGISSDKPGDEHNYPENS